MAAPQTTPGSGPRTVWLSGAIQTALNKLILPTVWLAALTGIVLWSIYATGRLAVAYEFRLFAALVPLATAFLIWLTLRLQKVGYSGKWLVVSNYWREERIAFEDVEAVEPVWWYRRRMVRVRFRRDTPFGDTVYYLPKWGPLRCLWSDPVEELRLILQTAPAAG